MLTFCLQAMNFGGMLPGLGKDKGEKKTVGFGATEEEGSDQGSDDEEAENVDDDLDGL